MDFSLGGTAAASNGGDVRILKQCRPISELEDHQGGPVMKLSRTDSFSSCRQQQQQQEAHQVLAKSSSSPEDHHHSQLLGSDPHTMLMYQRHHLQNHLQSYQQQQQQQQQAQYNSMKQASAIPSAGHFQQQQYFPFTASQWAELEHQALIFKYMMARAPVPPELLIPIRRSLILSPNAAGSAGGAWSGFQLGVASGSPMDAEPGRCRRTDGKKWRCSRPVVADQKYCERHMHRGRNRSRKAAEAAAAAAAAAANNHTGQNGSSNGAQSLKNSTNSSGSSGFEQQKNANANASANASSHHLGKGFGGSGMGIMEAGMGHHYPLQSASESGLHGKDQRFMNGMSKAQFDLRPEQLLFSEVSGSTRQLGGSGGGGGGSIYSSNCSGRMSPMIPTNDHQQFQQQQQQPQQIFQEIGNGGMILQDHPQSSPLIRGIERKPEPLRHFFYDWPRASKDSISWSDDPSEEQQGSKFRGGLNGADSGSIRSSSNNNTNSNNNKGMLSLGLEEEEEDDGRVNEVNEVNVNGVDNSNDGTGHGHGDDDEDDPYTHISLRRSSQEWPFEATPVGASVGISLGSNGAGGLGISGAAGNGGDLLAEVLKTNAATAAAKSNNNNMGFNLLQSTESSQQQQKRKEMMVLASPTGVLQKVTCFSDSSSSASSPGSVKNDASHEHKA